MNVVAHTDGTVEHLVIDARSSGDIDAVVECSWDIGQPSMLVSLLEPASVSDGLSFLREIANDTLTTPWQLGFIRDGSPVALHVVGAPHGSALRVCGATTGDVLLGLISRFWPEGATRDRLRRAAGMSAVHIDHSEQDAFVELTKTNNELVNLHRQLTAANARLEEMDRRRDQLMGMVAHDLRGPLGSIGSFAAAIERIVGSDLDPRALSMVERIGQLSEQMLHIVDDLLDVAVIKNDGLELELEIEDLAALVVDVVDMYRYVAAHKRLTFNVRGVDQPLLAKVDGGRILQVLDNLLSNAVKYSPNGEDATIEVDCSRDREQVVISIRNQGQGIGAEEIDQIFVPFGRASNEPTGGERSTGLGLPIANSIVQAHSGRIEVESVVGASTTFRLVLPTGMSTPTGDTQQKK